MATGFTGLSTENESDKSCMCECDVSVKYLLCHVALNMHL